MARFNVRVEPRETGAEPYTIEVSGGDILSQDAAEAHVTKGSHGRFTVIPKESPAPEPAPARIADEHAE